MGPQSWVNNKKVLNVIKIVIIIIIIIIAVIHPENVMQSKYYDIDE